MKKIGILYICTGPYALFWEDFYNSFEEKFLPNTEKHYYVFTDSNDLYMEKSERVNRIYLNSLPWPLITLFRFDTFLSIEKDLIGLDYLMFSNANIICNMPVLEEEFLPNSLIGETMCFTRHPGYYNNKRWDFPYDRNKKSSAYIPYNCGKDYVIGAMFCGKSDEYLKMCRVLKNRIEEDLKHNVIARWHDESHINRYIIGNKEFKLLSPSYCYPVGFDLPIDKKICGVSKQAKFDVNSFKGFGTKKQNILMLKLKKSITCVINKYFLYYIIDTILQKRISKLWVVSNRYEKHEN